MSLVIGSAPIRSGERQDISMEAQAIAPVVPRGAAPAVRDAAALHEVFRHRTGRRDVVREVRVIGETRRAMTPDPE